MLKIILIVFISFLQRRIAGNDDFDHLVRRYLEPWSRHGKISEDSIDALHQSATECHELQRILISHGSATFLGDMACKHKHGAVGDKRKFVVIAQRYFDEVARTCGQSIDYVDLVINLRDEPRHLDSRNISSPLSRSSEDLSAPVFTAQRRDDFLDVPIEYAVDAVDHSLHNFINEFTNTQSRHPAHFDWRRREQKLFWRGTQTGGMYGLHNWRDFPRSRLVLMARDAKDDVDARFTGWTQVYRIARMKMRSELGPLAPLATYTDHAAFRYLASLDGNGWANRLPFLMATGSLVFKQKSDYEAWWYPLFRAGEHYISLPADMEREGVLEAIRWARTHDDEARIIAEKAQHRVRELLGNESITNTYMCSLLQHYQTLLAPRDRGESSKARIERLVRAHGSNRVTALRQGGLVPV